MGWLLLGPVIILALILGWAAATAISALLLVFGWNAFLVPYLHIAVLHFWPAVGLSLLLQAATSILKGIVTVKEKS